MYAGCPSEKCSKLFRADALKYEPIFNFFYMRHLVLKIFAVLQTGFYELRKNFMVQFFTTCRLSDV